MQKTELEIEGAGQEEGGRGATLVQQAHAGGGPVPVCVPMAPGS